MDSLRPHGWRKFTHFLREWGLAGTVVTVFIGLLGLAGAGWYYAFNRIRENTQFETHTDDRLKTIDSYLTEIKQALAKQNLIAQAALPPTQEREEYAKLISIRPKLGQIASEPLEEELEVVVN